MYIRTHHLKECAFWSSKVAVVAQLKRTKSGKPNTESPCFASQSLVYTSVCVCVCMYVCMYVRSMYACVCIHMYICRYLYTYAHAHAHAHSAAHAHARVHTCSNHKLYYMNDYSNVLYVCVYVCMYVNVNVHAYIYIYIYILWHTCRVTWTNIALSCKARLTEFPLFYFLVSWHLCEWLVFVWGAHQASSVHLFGLLCYDKFQVQF